MKRIYGVKSILGGQDFYDENGNHVGYSVPGIGGGEDYFWDNGDTGYTVDSVISGQDYYGSDIRMLFRYTSRFAFFVFSGTSLIKPFWYAICCRMSLSNKHPYTDLLKKA